MNTIGKDFIALGEFLEAHPEMHDHMRFSGKFLFFAGQDALPVIAKAFGSLEKDVDSGYFMLRKSFGQVTLEANFRREEVCERVQTGEKEIPEQLIPARAEELIPAHNEPIYEWKCPKVLQPLAPPEVMAEIAE